MILAVVLVFFVLGCLFIWLLMFEEPREALLRWLMRSTRRFAGMSKGAWCRSTKRLEHLQRDVQSGMSKAVREGARYGWVILLSLLIVVLPAVLILGFRKNVVMGGFAEYDEASSGSMVAELMRGERLIPPPAPPEEVFTAPEVVKLHPEVVTADRRWQRVAPGLQQRVLAIYKVMKEQYGYEMVLVEGYRSPERQAQLMGAGKATRAGAWQSCHQYGLAVDSAPLRNGKLQWDMNDEWTRRAYFLYGGLAKQAGLEWGGDWRSLKDYVHVELKAECRAARRQRQATTVTD
ncbi:hypothetical protein CO611_09210 [Lysobacteraceae bacterium NML03-0222]|nr:hypothetical protein CO611_09210 [Xanthomonadaceae bacterium NML03-0222]